MANYQNLFQRGKIRNTIVKNRIVLSPMGDNLGNPDGSVSAQSIAYYAERAKGGAGIIMAGVFTVGYPQGKTITCTHRIDQPKYVKDLERLSREVHRYGALFIPQLNHAGMSTEVLATEGQPPLQISAAEEEIESDRLIGAMVDGDLVSTTGNDAKAHVLTTEGVKELVQEFINGAIFCEMAGCDGVELHAAHGYLICQFLTPGINKRTDEYGGSLENRIRFPLEIIRGIRQKCGPDFIIGVRMPVHKFETDGFTDEESATIAQRFQAEGVDFIDASGGFPPVISELMETQRYSQGNRVALAEKMKKAVTIPVMAPGVLREPDYCDQIIKENRMDFVVVGRGQLCDPEWSKKAKSGKANEIRKCISCLDACYGGLSKLQSMRCVLNPKAGYEAEFNQVKPIKKSRKIIIVGGGIAGMQAAITAEELGHKPIILEKTDSLGGQLNLACVPPNKEKIKWAIEWFEGEIERKKVEVHYNFEANADNITEMNPDYIIIANGSVPVIPSIPGIENAISSWDILGKKENRPEDKKIVILGGGSVACETGCLLADKNKSVTLLEMTDKAARGLELSHKIDLEVEMREKCIQTLLNCKVVKVNPDSVEYEENGVRKTINADFIIYSLGQKGHGFDLQREFDKLGIESVVVGDAKKARKIVDATREGFFAALNVDDVL
jgi:2,4-dienoyl-CoA reductase-like NADH-dependent reductase (Old Yellow Enzyme family)/thioredoxin reductase